MTNPPGDDAPEPNDVPTIQPEALAPPKRKVFGLSERLDPELFPDRPKPPMGRPPATLSNIRKLLHCYGVTVGYNLIKRKITISIPEHHGTVDNLENTRLNKLHDLCILNDISTTHLDKVIQNLADENPYNPVEEWMTRRPWDGSSRLDAFYATLVERKGYPAELKRALMKRWLLSAAAAARADSGFRSRGVLTLQGRQNIGKTSWVMSLVDDKPLQKEVVLIDHIMEPNNKDSKTSALTHWIVEFGELESSFGKDNARLKGFVTSPNSQIRLPYGRLHTDFHRRTVFVATVNDFDFLIDRTGNSRWWTIAVDDVDYQHKIDMQQLFAEALVLLDQSEQWWLNPEEEQWLADYNSRHQRVSLIRETLMENLDPERAGNYGNPPMTCKELLARCGIEQPTNPQLRECGAYLRELLGDSVRIRGKDKWYVPLRIRAKTEAAEPGEAEAEDDDDGLIY